MLTLGGTGVFADSAFRVPRSGLFVGLWLPRSAFWLLAQILGGGPGSPRTVANVALEGVGGDAGWLLGTAENRRRDDGPLTLPGPGICGFVNLPEW